MKWFIFNKKYPNQPLTWDRRALEFDTEESAIRFMESLPVTEENDGAYVKYCDLSSYKNTRLNATGKIVAYDDEGEEILVEVTK